MFCIYLIERIDGLMYIGMTMDIKRRIWQHKKSKRFEIGIKNYEIIADSLSFEEAEELEEFFIDKYDTFSNGLNVTNNGKTLNPESKFNTLGHKFSEEAKEKMRKNHWSRTGKYSPKGTKHSEESKRKMSVRRAGKAVWTKISKEQVIDVYSKYLSRPILENSNKIQKNGKMLTYDRLFSNTFCIDLNITGASLYNLIRGKYKTWNPLLLEIKENYKY